MGEPPIVNFVKPEDYTTGLLFLEVRNMKSGNGARNRNRTGTPVKARDFKSLVSTNFTIRAGRTAGILEARAGVEPTYTDLQSGA